MCSVVCSMSSVKCTGAGSCVGAGAGVVCSVQGEVCSLRCAIVRGEDLSEFIC